MNEDDFRGLNISPAAKLFYLDLKKIRRTDKTNGQLAEEYSVSIPTISNWLRELKVSGLVAVQLKGVRLPDKRKVVRIVSVR
jgi:DNA-binding transcriptional ArsR family regulator